MKGKGMSDEEFFKLYDAYDRPSAQDVIDKIYGSEDELSEIVEYLIRHRELLKNCNLETLEAEAEELLKKLRENQIKRLLEGIACFKEILELQKRLAPENIMEDGDK
jgi:hypothetical protein